MSPDRPWRLKDIKFRDEGNKRRGVIGPVAVVETGGRYSVTMESHNLKGSLGTTLRKKRPISQSTRR
jgi:hypothetical protein